MSEKCARKEMYEKISRLAESFEGELISWRRDFHKYAETGWLEMRASSLIARRLKNMGYEVLTGEDVCLREARMGVPSEEVLEEAYRRAVSQGADTEYVEDMRDGMTGVIGILRCGEGPVTAMRFDIDALGVFENETEEHFPRREGFASENTGSMHACGHDGHGAMGLGVAKVLMELKEELCGTVKLIFQPAEEGVRGAAAIVAHGHLDDVKYFIGSHITGAQEGNPAVVYPGSYGSLATTKLDVTYRGQAAHAGGCPEKGKNVLLAAATAVLNLNAIPRHSGGASRINVGTIHGGSGRNVIPDEVKLEIEVRGETTKINEYMESCARRILKSAADMYDVSCEERLMGAADSMDSSPGMMTRIRRVCEEDLGLPVTKEDSMKMGGSEDVSCMVCRVQEHGGEAAFMRLLTPEAGSAHSREFDFDEKVLVNGVKIFCGTVYDINGDGGTDDGE